MKEREEGLPGEEGVLVGRRSRHLDHHGRPAPHLFRGVDDGGPDLPVLLVAEAGGETRAPLDQHPVAAPHQGIRSGGGQSDALLAGPDLARDAEIHGSWPLLSWISYPFQGMGEVPEAAIGPAPDEMSGRTPSEYCAEDEQHCTQQRNGTER